jgi:hypothetical protein
MLSAAFEMRSGACARCQRNHFSSANIEQVSEVDQRTLAAQEHALQETQKAIAEVRARVSARLG